MKKRYFVILPLVVAIFTLNISKGYAARKIEVKDHFSSIRGSKANIRSGPGKHYPVKFSFNAKNVPVHVIAEYDNWNEVKDYQGHTGWINKALLTKRRSLMIVTSSGRKINMHNRPDNKSRVLYHLKRFVIGDYLECKKSWCKIRVAGKKGWVRRNYLFGD